MKLMISNPTVRLGGWRTSTRSVLRSCGAIAFKTKWTDSSRNWRTWKTAPTRQRKTAVKPALNDGAIGGLVRRLTGAASEALNLAPVKRELGGAITEQECQTLADCLTPSVGGLFLLPRACSGMLKGGEAAGPSVPHRNEDTDTDASGQKKGPTRL